MIKEILYKALMRNIGESADAPGTFSTISGDLNSIKAVEFVDQTPIGKSSRSNPATYLKAFDEIRKLYAEQQLSTQWDITLVSSHLIPPVVDVKNAKEKEPLTIEMQFMADITLECESCHGKRYSNDALEVEYRGKNIYDILNMTINEAIEFFSNSNGATEKKIVKRLKPLQDVGLGYIKLGQPSSTLSGGENQRVKLAYFLSNEKQEPTMFIFDEPTTGLHFHDINTLLKSFTQLLENGHSIVIIEHNMDVIKCADYIIDMGPEGGEKGGYVIGTGTPEEIAANPNSYTGKFLKEKIALDSRS